MEFKHRNDETTGLLRKPRDILEYFANFIRVTTENVSIVDTDLSNHILVFIATLSLTELYQLDKKYSYIGTPHNIGLLLHTKAQYVEKLQKWIYNFITYNRVADHILQVVDQIANSPNHYNMYEKFVEIIQTDEYEVDNIISCVEYRITNHFFDSPIESMLIQALNLIKNECYIVYDESGEKIYNWDGPRPKKIQCKLYDDSTSNSEPYNCSVCYEDYPDSVSRVYLCYCTHSFCVKCVKQMKGYRLIICPLCRNTTDTIAFVSQDILNTFTKTPVDDEQPRY